MVVFLLGLFIGTTYAQMEVLEFQRAGKIHKIKFAKFYIPTDKRSEALEGLYRGLSTEILVVFFSTNTEMWWFWTNDQLCIDIRSNELIKTIRKKEKKPEDVEIVIHNHPVSKKGVLPGLTYNDIVFYKKLKKAGIVNAKFQIWCEGIVFNNMDKPIQDWMSIEEFEKIKETLKSGETNPLF